MEVPLKKHMKTNSAQRKTFATSYKYLWGSQTKTDTFSILIDF